MTWYLLFVNIHNVGLLDWLGAWVQYHQYMSIGCRFTNILFLNPSQYSFSESYFWKNKMAHTHTWTNIYRFGNMFVNKNVHIL